MPSKRIAKSTPPTDATATAEVRVADRLRQLRMDKGMTLTELARRSGMSQAYLSRVENHRVAITIAGLERLAAALGAPMSAFFEQDGRTVPITVCRASQGERRSFRGPRAYVFEMLAAGKGGKLMEPLVVTLGSSNEDAGPSSHPGEEFNYVLAGECEFRYGNQSIPLHTGDAVYYDASVPHGARSAGKTECRLLVVVASRDYLFHGDLSKLLAASEA